MSSTAAEPGLPPEAIGSQQLMMRPGAETAAGRCGEEFRWTLLDNDLGHVAEAEGGLADSANHRVLSGAVAPRGENSNPFQVKDTVWPVHDYQRGAPRAPRTSSWTPAPPRLSFRLQGALELQNRDWPLRPWAPDTI
jgi:hypothetical protein